MTPTWPQKRPQVEPKLASKSVPKRTWGAQMAPRPSRIEFWLIFFDKFLPIFDRLRGSPQSTEGRETAKAGRETTKTGRKPRGETGGSKARSQQSCAYGLQVLLHRSPVGPERAVQRSRESFQDSLCDLPPGQDEHKDCRCRLSVHTAEHSQRSPARRNHSCEVRL